MPQKDTPKPKKTIATPMKDVTPSDAVPTGSTSRPVLITNRPMVADPMLAKSTPAQPANGAPVTHRQAKTISPLHAQLNPDAASTMTSAEARAAAEKGLLVEPSDSVSEVEPPPASQTEEVEEPSEAAELEPEVSNDSDEKTPVSDTEPSAEDEDDDEDEEGLPAPTEQTAEEARRQQLEELIAKGTYAVPVNRTRKRRTVYIAVLVGVIAFAILVGFILQDMELIALPGVPDLGIF